jgi:hypothetical protein
MAVDCGASKNYWKWSAHTAKIPEKGTLELGQSQNVPKDIFSNLRPVKTPPLFQR